MNLSLSELMDFRYTIAAALLRKCLSASEVLDQLHDFILSLGDTLDPALYDHPADGVWIARTAKIAPSAQIDAPCIIDGEAEVRHCAFIRGSAVIGRGAVVGNSTEIKNAILFDLVQTPHFNYCGDSILGYRAHLAAGVITSNVKADRCAVVIHTSQGDIPTGRRKFGALVGDYAEIGAGSVLNPGSVIGRNTTVYPLCRVRGVIPADSILKDERTVTPKRCGE